MLAAIAASFILWGCAAPKSFTDSFWKEHPTSVKIIYTEPMIENPGDLPEKMSDYQDHFSDWFEKQVVEKFAEESSHKIETSIGKVAGDDVSAQKVKLGDSDFDAPAYTQSVDADVYLVMSEIWLGQESEEYQTVQGNQASMAMETVPYSGTAVYKYFKAKCKYAFYDAKTRKILAYGNQEGEAQYQFSVTDDDWVFAVKSLVGSIVSNTPILPW